VDIKEALTHQGFKAGDSAELSGWLVDTDNGLFILGDHFPEDYFFPYRIRIANDNIIYPILNKIPTLGGGSSLLFYRTIVQGTIAKPISTDMEIDVRKIFVESNRESGLYDEVNVSQEIVQGYVNKFGSYKFSLSDPLRDWLDDE
jgi:hypothetical protein